MPSDDQQRVLDAEELAEIRAITDMATLESEIRVSWKERDLGRAYALHERKAELVSAKREQQEAADTTQMQLAVASASALSKSKAAETESGDTSTIQVPEERHREFGDMVKSVIYGGLDGIITTFAVVAGVQGADLKPAVILVLGFANLVADGMSMGVGDYLSEKAEQEFVASERQREEWEFNHFAQMEVEEMVEIYMAKGIEQQDARLILDTMAKYHDFFIDHMMVQELGLMPGGEEIEAIKASNGQQQEEQGLLDQLDDALKNGMVTMGSFLVFGCVPLLSYVVLAPVKFKGFDPSFLVSILLTLMTLCALGVLKSKLTETDVLKSAIFTTLNGAAAAGASYLIGFALSEITNVREHDRK